MDLVPHVDIAALMIGAFMGGLVDAVVGGSGLIQIPLLFSALPDAAPASVFGTNKMASVFGTSSAALRFGRRVRIPWHVVLPAAISAFFLSYAGAMTVTLIPSAVLRPLVLVLLVSMGAYTYVRKDFGATNRTSSGGSKGRAAAICIGGVIGFYDGFFGPGTGSFLIFLFIRLAGFDFLHASASSKVVNVATNVAALLYFGRHGHVLLDIGAAMACANVFGSIIGAHLALKHGSGFVRQAFLVVVGVLIAKFGYDTFA